MTVLTLPWPPSVNHYWRHVGARVLISRQGREYRRAVIRDLQLQTFPPSGKHHRLAVNINVFPPDRRRRDLDNLLKSVLDAMEHAGVYADDAQIDQLIVSRREALPGGQLTVKVDIINDLGV